ncbi:serine/threonine phosphatase stp [Faecalibacterium duncaniae]|uniref:Serine/threonine phosphatase stp n=2 Tax=Faecalibacterium duncaniae (strain DSM 17677 / JCM 31915 / A2-165) TaxID=411483 RepID=C7H5I0_FAED2|nr:serine/threonine phosphatase stp [Faecalibacterium duncaniae]
MVRRKSQEEKPMKLAGKTDVGRVRQENQDDYRAGELPGGAVWALVCDGMGGAKGGREASQGACNVIEQVFQEQYAQCGAGQEGAFLKKALISANRYVFNKAAHEESLAGMGTTAVCALVRGGEATLCHAGDSRAYLCRDGKLTQLTHDHSYVQELVDCGTITEEEAEHHPQKNIITRALGVDYRLEPEVTSVQLQAKDLLLLCSDGLTNMVPVEQMEQLLAQGPFYDLPDRLVDAANENGGSDNITALLLAVEPTEVHHG